MEIRLPLPALEGESERFWRACREGRLEILRCGACGLYLHPPRPVCRRCGARELAWTPVSGRATVVSFTVNHQRWMPGLEVPYTIGLVELVEQPDLRLTTNLVGVDPAAVRVGVPVKVTFRPVSDDVALPVFEPDAEPRPATAAPPRPSPAP
ncbi:MAG TPA: Zn-ribbon domain-containing OB-fold protein, partial [Candidatus Binatia bacterium]|nr:Zn-ribbon domain-containing OB-fold protein [Candidatus Binatia bacterium]